MTDICSCIEIKSGRHAGELAIVVEVLSTNIFKVLTLEGDYHYVDADGEEVKHD